jgi:hypothetical protein
MNFDNISNPPPPEQAPAPGQNALLSSGARAALPRPPTHSETTAALKHFSAIRGELKTLANNPSLGRSSVKSALIDAATRLVADRFLSPSEAVQQMASFPNEPLLQMKWVKQMLAQTAQAANSVLDHHAMGTQGTLDWGAESQHAGYNADDHLSIMQGLAGNYRPVA